VTKNEAGGSQIKIGRGEKSIQNYYLKNMKGCDFPKDVVVDWRVIIKWILQK
jgi:hypothetical protein